MKKYLLSICFLFSNLFYSFGQTTATDFTAFDCSGASHHLFAELDAGKIIVISFVEPCAACIGPSHSAQTTVQNCLVSNPGASVIFYISSDFGTYPCSSLVHWASLNGLVGTSGLFSDPAFVTTQYGSTPYMPKVVVLGGPDHRVFLNEEGALATFPTDLQTAINTAIASTLVPQTSKESFQMNVFPNPASDIISFSFSLNQPSDVTIELFNLIGSKVYAATKEKLLPGRHEIPVNIGNNMSNGIYFIKLTAGDASGVFKFIVEK